VGVGMGRNDSMVLELIAGRYQLIESAGEGGMASVYRAIMHGAAGFARPVAVKKIKRGYRSDQHYIAMFVEEARVGSELAHPNIVQVLDFCVDTAGDYYLVMEWVEGLDLGSFVKAFTGYDQPTHWPLMVAVGIGALRGLAAAHERRRVDGTAAPVIHRDVSPHNILLGINGSVKLTDFGLARARDRSVSLTAPGTVKGKISYLAPEVAWGKTATPLSDIFTMGVVMWEILAGKKLFDSQSDLETFARIRNADVPPLADERPDLPSALVEAVHKATEKEPKDRFRSARDMAMALSECLREQEMSMDIQTLLGTSVAQAREALGYIEPSDDSATTNQIDAAAFSFDIDLDAPRINPPAALQSAETQVGVIGGSESDLSSISEVIDVGLDDKDD